MARKNIVLIGFMATGKTAIGRMVAQRLGYRFIDIDEEIEREQKTTITALFRERGEAAFREIESATVRRIAGTEGVVIATGGGAVLRSDNVTALRGNGVLVCLSAEPETILKRTAGSADRPLLNVDDPLARIKELLAARQPLYEQADLVVPTDDRSPVEIADEIIESTKDRNRRYGPDA